MSVTPSADLAGVLPVVISGGRPELTYRTTRKFLAGLHGVTADPVWLVREDRAEAYERDEHELVTFGVAEAEEYAREHWMSPDPYVFGGFLGAFCEREWACRLAAERGYWGVLQLDDNITRINLFTGYGATVRVLKRHSGLGLFADLIAAVTLSTNARMTGAKLGAVNPQNGANMFARAGFPYSCFIERLDLPDREPWVGPFEDDILHAYAYASRADDATAALVHPIEYLKEQSRTATTGMRSAYTERRAAGLAMVAPEVARAAIKKTRANGRGGARIFHHMTPRAVGLRMPLVIKDPVLFNAARDYCTALREEVKPELRADAEGRVNKWAAQAQSRQALLDHLAGVK